MTLEILDHGGGRYSIVRRLSDDPNDVVTFDGPYRMSKREAIELLQSLTGTTK